MPRARRRRALSLGGGRALVEPVMLDKIPGDLCRMPYPGHPRGCPNYGKRPSCPPRARMLHEIIRPPIWAVWNDFPIGDHARRMWRLHPDWTERQAYCCLYWQGGARAQLKSRLEEMLVEGPSGRMVIRCPEACGVDVTATMATVCVHLEWPPRVVARQVALVGLRR